MDIGNVSALTECFGRLLDGSYPANFRNLSGHQSIKADHHVKMADHGGLAL